MQHPISMRIKLIFLNLRVPRFFFTRSSGASFSREILLFRSYFRIQNGSSVVILFIRLVTAYTPLEITPEAILPVLSISQFCYSHISVMAVSFLHGSCCHQQVQTVPSS